MEDTLVEVEILKMINAGCYLIKEKGLTSSSREFSELCAKMDAHFNSDGFAMQAVNPVLGKNYIGKERDKWLRVRVDNIVQRTTGLHASCYLLDYGRDCVMIPLRWLRQTKDEFFKVPFQVRQAFLHNIRPITLVMDADLNNSWGPAVKWDEASLSFMRDEVFQQTKVWKASFVLEKEGSCEIDLYALNNQDTVHINELLVLKKYAAYKDCDSRRVASHSSGSPSNRTAIKAANSDDSDHSHCSAASDSTPSPTKRLQSMGRGALLRSMVTGSPVPQVGRSSRTSSSASDSDHSLLRKPEKSPMHAGLVEMTSARTSASRGDTRFSNSDRETDDSSGDRKCRLSKSSPGMPSSSVSYVESRQQMAENPSESKGFTEPRKSSGAPAIQSRLPKQLRKETSNTISSSDQSDFVLVNTNFQSACAQQQDSSFSRSDSTIHNSTVDKLESFHMSIPVALSKPTTEEEMDILVDGNKFVKCVTDVNDQPFIDLIRKTPHLMDMGHPTKLQSFIWPAVMRGFDVVGICASRPKSGSPGGKTLSYLLPIISLLNFRSTYKDLPKFSVSPYVLILCPTWDQVLKIYDQCQLILEHQHELRLHQIKIRVKLLFGGGGDDENKQVDMINGCEILVSTPHSFLRMMDKKLTNLSRVCHLVLEGANVLTEAFKPEMTRIMDQYKLELKERQGSSVPQQVLIFGPRWNSALKKFSLEYQVSPVVVIASKMEAAYFGEVRHRPVMCSYQQLFNKVLSLLETRTRKVLVFTSSSEQAKILHEAIRAASIHALLACDEMNSSDLALVKREWQLHHRTDSLPVLVLTDSISNILCISDAVWVIHFDVPSQAEIFADRLWCLRKYFELYEGGKLTEEDNRVSFILITERCENMSSRLIQVLQRCESSIPSSLSVMSERYMERNEQGKQSQLCHSLKSFGFCRNQIICPYRHKVFLSLDQPGNSPRHIKLPVDGTIKVWIRHVVDASCFYVNLHEHRDLDGHVTPLRTDYAELSVNMAEYFTHASNRHLIDKAGEGELYAIKDIQHVFHRVEVLRVFASDTASHPDEVEVFQVDVGGSLTVNISEMYELPSQLAQVPYQAVEVFICRIKPVDNDFTWTNKAQMYLAEKIKDATLCGNIVLSLGNSLWVDPLQQLTWLPKFSFWQHNFTVRLLLLEANFAEENPKHLELLYKACDGIVQLPSGLSTALNTSHAYTFDGCLVRTKAEEFSEGDLKYHDVYLTAIKSPDLLYVQLASNENFLNQLDEEISRFMNLTDDKTSFEPKKGLLVLVKDSYSGWCRGKIMEIPQGKPIEVFCVDTGITCDLPLQDIIPMPSRFKLLPFQAIECSLVGIEPVQDAYLERCTDFILNSTGDQQGKPIKLQALIVQKTEARYSGRYHYGVELHDFSSTSYHVNIASQLIVEKFAKLSSNKLEALYPFAYCEIRDHAEERSYRTRFSILCRDLLKNESKETVDKTAAELERMTEEVCSSSSSCCGLVAIVGQTLEYSWEAETAHAIILSLKLLIKKNPNHCAELEYGKILDVLCHVFVKHELNGLQEEMLLLFSSVLACTRCCEMFVKCGGLWYLANDLSKSSVDCIIKAESQLVFTTLKNSRESGLTTGHEKCLEAAIKHLGYPDTFVVQHCLEIIEHLLTCFSKYKDEIRKSHGIQVLCSHLETWSDKKILCQALKILARLTVDNGFNRAEVTENIPSSLHEKFQTDVDVQNLYDDLRNRIRRSLPLAQRITVEPNAALSCKSTRSKNRQSIDNQPIPKEQLTTVFDCRRPSVKWTQNLWDILLTVEVKDAKKLDDVAAFTNDSITFQTVAMCTEYSFHFTLYELIVPEKCETSINAGCIYVGLKKKSRGIWPRLLRDKLLKCPFLSIDFNRFEDILEGHSDDEIDNEDEDQFKSPLGLMYSRTPALLTWHLPSSENAKSKYENGTPDFSVSVDRSSLSNDSSSSLESDEELDSKFDPRFTEDAKFGYHTF